MGSHELYGGVAAEVDLPRQGHNSEIWAIGIYEAASLIPAMLTLDSVSELSRLGGPTAEAPQRGAHRVGANGLAKDVLPDSAVTGGKCSINGLAYRAYIGTRSG